MKKATSKRTIRNLQRGRSFRMLMLTVECIEREDSEESAFLAADLRTLVSRTKLSPEIEKLFKEERQMGWLFLCCARPVLLSSQRLTLMSKDRGQAPARLLCLRVWRTC
jgi:hypothetical protein